MDEYALIMRHKHLVLEEDGSNYQCRMRIRYEGAWRSAIRMRAQVGAKIALSKANGTGEAIAEAKKLQLTGNQYYFSLLGTLYSKIDREESIAFFEQALRISKSDAEKSALRKKIETLKTGESVEKKSLP